MKDYLHPVTQSIPPTYFTQSFPFQDSFEYTDDTAMAFSVADSLLAKDKKNDSDSIATEVDIPDLARRFTEEYFREPRRGYGGAVITVYSLE